MNHSLHVLIILSVMQIVSSTGVAQHLYQLPKPLKPQSELEAIIGERTGTFSKEVNIVWVYGYDEHHIAGAHDYVLVKDSMVSMLRNIPRVTVEEAFHFPNEDQLDKADLLVMYLHLPQLKKKQFAALQDYVSGGGGIVSLHETAIMRPNSKGALLSKCLGMAWNEGTSKWGAIFDLIDIDNEHPVFEGFPERINIVDEFYWDLYIESDVEVLGTVRTGPEGEDVEGPVPLDQLSETVSPMFWTYQLGQGRVFGTTTGHHTFTYFDPEFRIILFRAMAWAIDEPSGPFMPLVFKGITNQDQMVGTTDPMRYWEGKRRK